MQVTIETQVIVEQERLAALIHEHTVANAALGRRISTHETIRRILRVLALEEITLGQAIGILAETAERNDDPEQQELYQQAIATLRQMQADFICHPPLMRGALVMAAGGR